MNIFKALIIAIVLTGCARSHKSEKEIITLKSDSPECRDLSSIKV